MNNKQLELWVLSTIEQGISADRWAKAAGFERGNFIRNFLKKRKDGVDAGLNHETVIKLQAALEKLLPTAASKLHENTFNIHNSLPNDNVSSKTTVPVYGAVAASADGIVTLTEQNIVGKSPTPTELENVRDGFIMIVSGESMRPRYKHGERVSVDKYKWPAMEQDCVIVLDDEGNAILKEFAGETTNKKSWRFRQYNPDKYIEIPKKDVRHIFAVVGRPS